MAASISSALNEFLAANFPDAAKSAYIQPQQQQAQQQIVQAEEAEESGYEKRQQQDSQRSAYFQQANARQQSLKDIGSPQIELAPSDQIDLFASGTADTRLIGKLDVTAPSELTDSATILNRKALTNGTNISQSLLQKAQASVGALYARNNDIVYNATPAINEAA
ncbi:MAG: hypothetical protein WDN72_01125 [Alphaproteobacteria bacterium]